MGPITVNFTAVLIGETVGTEQLIHSQRDPTGESLRIQELAVLTCRRNLLQELLGESDVPGGRPLHSSGKPVAYFLDYATTPVNYLKTPSFNITVHLCHDPLYCRQFAR